VNLTSKVITEIAHAPVAAGTSNVTDCKVIDMAGCDGVRFVVGFGTLTATAVTSIKVQQADAKTSDTALTSGADLAGSYLTVPQATGSNKLFITDIYRPTKRYVQLHILRGTANAVVDLAVSEKYGVRTLPVTQNAGVNGWEVAASPSEGTA